MTLCVGLEGVVHLDLRAICLLASVFNTFCQASVLDSRVSTGIANNFSNIALLILNEPSLNGPLCI